MLQINETLLLKITAEALLGFNALYNDEILFITELLTATNHLLQLGSNQRPIG